EVDEGLDCDETPPSGCETAYARYAESNSCFIDDGLGANRWGWTNYLPTTGNYSLDLYAAAGQCVLSNGEKTADVDVAYNNGEITVTINLLNGFVMTEAQLYLGGAPYPLKNGSPTVASGQFPYKAENLNNVTSHTFGPIAVGNDGVHMILHAVTCGSAPEPVQLVSVQPYHKRFENSIELEINTPYDAVIDVQFMDMSGKTVMKKRAGNVTRGKNLIPLSIHGLATEVHIMRIDTGKEVITQKVYFHK
ncbi:MAG: T9SS type A sorting domain-containing protein, partial [Eudoraea sp.]|nr:T9SS type A sorting domain-containing protein [Eudoraea sp.]